MAVPSERVASNKQESTSRKKKQSPPLPTERNDAREGAGSREGGREGGREGEEASTLHVLHAARCLYVCILSSACWCGQNGTYTHIDHGRVRTNRAR